MKVDILPVKCNLCGGEGFADIRSAGCEWFGGEYYHKDPRVCKETLKRKEKETERAKVTN